MMMAQWPGSKQVTRTEQHAAAASASSPVTAAAIERPLHIVHKEDNISLHCQTVLGQDLFHSAYPSIH